MTDPPTPYYGSDVMSLHVPPAAVAEPTGYLTFIGASEVLPVPEPSRDPEVARLLEEAADVIEVRGHHKRAWDDSETDHPTGAVCVRGALVTAQCGSPRFITSDPFGERTAEESRALVEVIRTDETLLWELHRFLGLPLHSHDSMWLLSRHIVHWNDHPDRTPYEVCDALRGAAKEVRNRA